MKQETQGWGDSVIATKYVYQRIHDLLDSDLDKGDTAYELSRFLDELAHNFKVDTGKRIGEKL